MAAIKRMTWVAARIAHLHAVYAPLVQLTLVCLALPAQLITFANKVLRFLALLEPTVSLILHVLHLFLTLSPYRCVLVFLQIPTFPLKHNHTWSPQVALILQQRFWGNT